MSLMSFQWTWDNLKPGVYILNITYELNISYLSDRLVVLVGDLHSNDENQEPVKDHFAASDREIELDFHLFLPSHTPCCLVLRSVLVLLGLRLHLVLVLNFWTALESSEFMF